MLKRLLKHISKFWIFHSVLIFLVFSITFVFLTTKGIRIFVTSKVDYLKRLLLTSPQLCSHSPPGLSKNMIGSTSLGCSRIFTGFRYNKELTSKWHSLPSLRGKAPQCIVNLLKPYNPARALSLIRSESSLQVKFQFKRLRGLFILSVVLPKDISKTLDQRLVFCESTFIFKSKLKTCFVFF